MSAAIADRAAPPSAITCPIWRQTRTSGSPNAVCFRSDSDVPRMLTEVIDHQWLRVRLDAERVHRRSAPSGIFGMHGIRQRPMLMPDDRIQARLDGIHRSGYLGPMAARPSHAPQIVECRWGMVRV